MAIPSLASLIKRRDLSGVVSDTISYLSLQPSKKVLFITTSTRYPFNTHYDKGGVENELPKSTELALFIKEQIPNKSEWLDIPQLKIVPCEGNVSHKSGNSCGILDAKLTTKDKNPTGHHRCWASLNDPSDQLWRVSKEVFKSDIILFFGSIRWGQTNSEYQKLIERLTWLENRHTTLGEENLLEGKQAGFICIGQNWNGANVTVVQKTVLDAFGFDTPDSLFWNWQYTSDFNDETQQSYTASDKQFHLDLGIPYIDVEKYD
jgi:multimeric flavodoxin WrbA